jgi:hypothetical protein
MQRGLFRQSRQPFFCRPLGNAPHFCCKAGKFNIFIIVCQRREVKGRQAICKREAENYKIFSRTKVWNTDISTPISETIATLGADAFALHLRGGGHGGLAFAPADDFDAQVAGGQRDTLLAKI